MKNIKVAIVGSGPAGIATALSLARLTPELAGDMVVLEKASHPRPKLCGGGLTVLADQVLEYLEVETAPGFPVHHVILHLNRRPVHFEREGLMRVVHRQAFDAELAMAARKLGITIHEDEPVVDLRRGDNAIDVLTSRQNYRCKVVVAADGARSVVRRKMFREEPSRVSRLLEVVVPVNGDEVVEFRENTAVLDFREMQNGLQGYLWDFPTLIQEQPHLNIGIFDSRVLDGQRADLPGLLGKRLEARGLSSHWPKLEGHPERWFEPTGTYSRPNVILVGDAAGIEPLFGEGISFALAYGLVAARAISEAFQNQDFSFAGYRDLILSDHLGKLLARNRKLAYYFYRQEYRAFFSLLARAFEFYFKVKACKAKVALVKP